VQSVLEGVALAFRDGLTALSDAGTVITELSVIGGGSRSDHWAGLLSAALERTLVIRDAAAVGPAFGAARLAALALRQTSEQELCSPPAVVRVIDPDPMEVQRLRERSEQFRHLYRALREQFPR